MRHAGDRLVKLLAQCEKDSNPPVHAKYLVGEFVWIELPLEPPWEKRSSS